MSILDATARLIPQALDTVAQARELTGLRALVSGRDGANIPFMASHVFEPRPWPAMPKLAANAEDEIIATGRSVASRDPGHNLRPGGVTMRAADLVGTTAQQRERWAAELRHAFAWVDDGHCHTRAWVAAEMINREIRSAPGMKRADAAVQTVLNFDGTARWKYHSVVGVKDAASGAMHVFDPLMFPKHGFIELDQYAASLPAKPVSIDLREPTAMASGNVRFAPWQLVQQASHIAASASTERLRDQVAARDAEILDALR